MKAPGPLRPADPARRSGLPRLLFAVLFVLAIVHWAYRFPLLPDPMVARFGFAGEPGGWSSKTAFFVVYLAVVALTAVFAFGVPALAAAWPSVINIPHRAHWLAPERRSATLGFLHEHFAWFACAMLVFIVAVTELVLRANLAPEPRLPSAAFWALMLAYGGFVALWIVVLFRRFPRPGP